MGEREKEGERMKKLEERTPVVRGGQKLCEVAGGSGNVGSCVGCAASETL